MLDTVLHTLILELGTQKQVTFCEFHTSQACIMRPCLINKNQVNSGAFYLVWELFIPWEFLKTCIFICDIYEMINIYILKFFSVFLISSDNLTLVKFWCIQFSLKIKKVTHFTLYLFKEELLHNLASSFLIIVLFTIYTYTYSTHIYLLATMYWAFFLMNYC